MRMLSIHKLFCVAVLSLTPPAQGNSLQTKVDVRMHILFPQAQMKHHTPPAVLWLKPLQGTPLLPFPPRDNYTLVQKNRMFSPHLLIVPVGSTVLFPNKDPFFHNVFSLFDGKRFDLGLYEAGSTKEVKFSREGISYIFCNIHPEMSAVILALPTPLYAIAANDNSFTLTNVPPGDYRLHLWIEGLPLSYLDTLIRNVHIGQTDSDLGELTVAHSSPGEHGHTNKFGMPYPPVVSSPYP